MVGAHRHSLPNSVGYKMSMGYKVYETRAEEDRTELEQREDHGGAFMTKCLIPCCLCWICTALVGIVVAMIVLFVCYLPKIVVPPVGEQPSPVLLSLIHI